MPYRVELNSSARIAIRKLAKGLQRRVLAKLEGLKENPRPNGVKKLQAEDGLYRIRIGDYRVVYQINDDTLLVLVVRVADRKDVYG